MQSVYLVRRTDYIDEQPYVVGCFSSLTLLECELNRQDVSLDDFKKYYDPVGELYYAEMPRLTTSYDPSEPSIDILRYTLNELHDINSN